MTARERLEAVLAADVLDAIEELVAERVGAVLAGVAPNGSPWLSLAQAADYLGISDRTIARDLARGRLRASSVGRRRLLHRDELDAYAKGDGGGEAPATPPRRLGGSVE
jgi:excisionase family DNA binding protein